MKKFVSCVLVFVLMLGLLSLPAESAAIIANIKMTDALSAAFLESSTAKAYITMSDVDHTLVMKHFQNAYPLEYEAYMMAKFDVEPTSGNVITDELLQSALERKREIYRLYYEAANQAVVSASLDAEDILHVSSYAPMAVVEITQADAVRLAQSTSVLSLDVMPDTQLVSSAESSVTYSYADMVATLETANEFMRIDEVRDTYGLTGSGVKVGILEGEGIPDTTNPYLADTTIYTRSGDTNVTDHATFIAIEIAGQNGTTNYGAAPDAELYCCYALSDSEFYSAAEWLINQGVNVINVSTGFGNQGDYNTTYNPYDAWLDHVAVMHDVHVVVAAGNTVETYVDSGVSYYIHSPAMAYNAISVGAYNSNQRDSSLFSIYTISEASCYEEIEATATAGRPEKPNLVANGHYMWNSDPDDRTGCGTSFACPQVVGVIAQLCSYSSALKYKQTAMGAILMASAARKIDGDTFGEKGDIFDASVQVENNPQVSEKEGAGILDAYWARGIVIRGNYWSPTVYSTGFPYTKEVTIDTASNTVSRVAIFWLARNSVSTHSSGAYTITPVANLNLYVYDPNGNLVGSSTLTYANYEIVQFVPTVTGTYRIVITGESTEKEYIGIALW